MHIFSSFSFASISLVEHMLSNHQENDLCGAVEKHVNHKIAFGICKIYFDRIGP